MPSGAEQINPQKQEAEPQGKSRTRGKLSDPTQSSQPSPTSWSGLAPSCILGTQYPHLGLGMHGETQQSMVHLQGHRVAPGLQILLSQKGGHAREDLEEKRQTLSAPPTSDRWE